MEIALVNLGQPGRKDGIVDLNMFEPSNHGSQVQIRFAAIFFAIPDQLNPGVSHLEKAVMKSKK